MTSKKISSTRTHTLQGRNIRVRYLGLGAEIHRLYRFPGGDFKPAPPQFRTGRLDPPVGHSNDFGMLYAADSLFTAAIEGGALLLMPTMQPTYQISQISDAVLPPARHVVLRALKEVGFVDFTDHATARLFGLNLNEKLDRLSLWRKAAAELVGLLRQEGVVQDIVGVYYRSKRHPTAFNYALIDGQFQQSFVANDQGDAKLNELLTW